MLYLLRVSTKERIDQVRSLEHGLYLIRVNEAEDKEIGCYKKDDYDIVDDYGRSIM